MILIAPHFEPRSSAGQPLDHHRWTLEAITLRQVQPVYHRQIYSLQYYRWILWATMILTMPPLPFGEAWFHRESSLSKHAFEQCESLPAIYSLWPEIPIALPRSPQIWGMPSITGFSCRHCIRLVTTLSFELRLVIYFLTLSTLGLPFYALAPYMVITSNICILLSLQAIL